MTEPHRQVLLAIGLWKSRYTLMMDRSYDQAPTREDLELFGNTWFHLLKVDWDEAFRELEERDLIRDLDGRWTLTPTGLEAKRNIEVERPLWLYEYENYYSLAPSSEAHQRFCEAAYGQDLCQHGLVDQRQLDRLLEHVTISPVHHVLDLGCGNGYITAWLAEQTGASFIGLDLSQVAVDQANALALQRESRLKFVQGNMNLLELPQGSYDIVVSIDTFYYLDNPAVTLEQVRQVLKPGGKLVIFWTQFVMDSKDADRLTADNTDMANMLKENGFALAHHNLSIEGYAHWQKKLAVLEALEPVFEKEGSEWLYLFRHREATRYANWDRELTSRYLYVATLADPASSSEE